MEGPPNGRDEHRQRLLAVEPFSIGSAGGGPRIMRSLLRAAPTPVLAVSTSPERDAQVGERDDLAEVHLPARPSLGRLERTRAFKALGTVDLFLLDRLTSRLALLASARSGPTPRVAATSLHCLSHTMDFVAVARVAERLALPLFLSVHDDPGYVLRGCVERKYVLQRLGPVWRSADQRFVISEEMGLEMCRRYGDRSYVIVTDGLESVAPSPRPQVAGRLSVYFMGAAHTTYAESFQCLLSALARLRGEGVDARLITRAGELPFTLNTAGVPLEARPWAPQAQVARDLDEVDLDYMPLPFGREHADFVRFSLSTKMVTYLGSGVPLLFHGPRESAAANLLRQADAGLLADSLDVGALAELLGSSGERLVGVAENALRLARARFLLSEIRERFWQPILAAGQRSDARQDREPALGDPRS